MMQNQTLSSAQPQVLFYQGLVALLWLLLVQAVQLLFLWLMFVTPFVLSLYLVKLIWLLSMAQVALLLLPVLVVRVRALLSHQ